jgi:hypothetical protein
MKTSVSHIRQLIPILLHLINLHFMEDDPCIILPVADRMSLAVAYKTRNPLTPIRVVAHLFDVPTSTLGHRLNGRRDVKTFCQSRQRLLSVL